jgi:small-conductance mechanosensitive channel
MGLDGITLDFGGVFAYTIQPGVLAAAAAFMVTLAMARFFRFHILAYLKRISTKTKTDIDNLLLDLIEKIPWTFYVLISFFVAFRLADVPSVLSDTLWYAILAVLVYYMVRAVYIIIDFSRDFIIKKRKAADPHEDISLIELLARLLKYSMWFVAFLLILSNAGVDITTLIAGMGVGGLAIALAAQNVLGDIFSAFSIYFDKPYKVGDFIMIGSDMGTVEKIGIKTTRIKTLNGWELVVENKEMSSSRVNNFGRFPRRRVVYDIGVTYQTPVERMREIPVMVKKIIDDQEMTTYDRVHFKKFGDFSLVFEIVYYVESPDYNLYMDKQQAINLSIMEAFKAQGIEFAYPTQTLFLEK